MLLNGRSDSKENKVPIGIATVPYKLVCFA